MLELDLETEVSLVLDTKQISETRETTENADISVSESSGISDEVQTPLEGQTPLEAQTPLARVCGQTLLNLPQDLYIPPDAMEVILEVFEGPLDLLLYLIKKHNIDILNIPVADITRQYMEYMDVMTTFRIELAADYLEMAAFLTEIKSRMLLPRPPSETEEALDPRAELVKRLQEYERFKQAAEHLDKLPRLGRDIFFVQASAENIERIKIHPEVDLRDVLLAFKDVLNKADLKAVHTVAKEGLSVREKMSDILARLKGEQFIEFVSFFNMEEGRLGIVVSFLAILELTRESMIELVQNENFGPIYIRVPGC